MPLDDLYELIETLQARINAHAPEMQKSEALTRYALIDPLLRGLGWDTGDPSQVLVEYQSGGGSADYALLAADGQPKIIVEAKRLGTPLQGAVTQGINYCIQLGIPYFALTEGRQWELYETFLPVPLQEKLVMQLNLKGSIAKTCLDALALWRQSAADDALASGAHPVLDATSQIPQESTAVEMDVVQVEPDAEWHVLLGFKPESGSKPAAVRFSDGQMEVAHSWSNLNAEIVAWLKAGGQLLDSDLPFKLGNATSYFVNRVNDKGGEEPFKTWRVVDGWFMNANYNAAQHMNNARGVIQRAGLNPADFAVKLQ